MQGGRVIHTSTGTEAFTPPKIGIISETRVFEYTDSRSVTLFPPVGEEDLRLADNDRWNVRVEGFALDQDFTGVWVLDGAIVEATRSAALRLPAGGALSLTGNLADLTALGLPAPAAGGSNLSYEFGNAAAGFLRSNTVPYLP
jgi:hypothetical protein